MNNGAIKKLDIYLKSTAHCCTLPLKIKAMSGHELNHFFLSSSLVGNVEGKISTWSIKNNKFQVIYATASSVPVCKDWSWMLAYPIDFTGSAVIVVVLF